MFTRAAFCRAWAGTFGLGWEPLAGREELGLVFAESRRLGLRDYLLAPRGLYWGASGATADAAAGLVDLALEQCSRRRLLGLTWSFRHDAREQLDAARRRLGDARCRVVESTTHVIDLAGKSFDDYLQRDARPATRRWIRRASEAGLEIRRLAGAGELREHHALYRAWAAEVDAEVHPEDLFARLAAELGESVSVIGAFFDGTLAAAIVVFREQREWMYWHGVRDRELERSHALDALLAHEIAAACAAGVSAFNLGASSGVASLERFKERWGARPRPVWSRRWRSPTWSAVLSGWQWLKRRAHGR